MSKEKRKEQKKLRRLKKKKKAAHKPDISQYIPFDELVPDDEPSCNLCKYRAIYDQCLQCRISSSIKKKSNPFCGPSFCLKLKEKISYQESFYKVIDCPYYEEETGRKIFGQVKLDELSEEISKDVCEECIKNSNQIYKEHRENQRTALTSDFNILESIDNDYEKDSDLLHWEMVERVAYWEQKEIKTSLFTKEIFRTLIKAEKDNIHVSVICQHGDLAACYIIEDDAIDEHLRGTSHFGWLMYATWKPISYSMYHDMLLDDLKKKKRMPMRNEITIEKIIEDTRIHVMEEKCPYTHNECGPKTCQYGELGIGECPIHSIPPSY